MKSKPELFIAYRLGLGGADGSSVPIGVRIGEIGVALAFVIMLLSLAVVTGFKREICRKVLGYESQIMLYGRETVTDSLSVADFNSITLTPSLSMAIKKTLGDVSVSGITDLPVLLKTDSAFSALILRCVDNRYDRSFIKEAIKEGDWQPSDSSVTHIAISETTANELGLHVGDRVFAHFFRHGVLSTRRLSVGAIYNTHFDDYDSHFAFGEHPLAISVAKLPDSTFSSITINGLPNGTDLEQKSSELASLLINDALRSQIPTSQVPAVKSFNQTGALYLNWLQLLDTNVVVIITLMSVVAGFTLVSSLFILILERIAMIGLLKAIGATNRQIRGIFIWLAEKIVLRGLLAGNIIGLTLCLVQQVFHIIPLNPDAYYLNYVPVSLSVSVILLLNAGMIAGSMIILVLPSQIITNMSPSRSLRRHNESDE